MFNRMLIANRGEIACRIIRTARKMGIETIAIYSSVDKFSEHVRLADQAYYVGEAAAKSSYLNIAAIIEAARLSGAEAIHPGYGFLSENPQFARACAKADIVFIGPPIDAMEAMASKQAAKQLLEKTSVPLTPGYHGKDQTDAHLLLETEKIGYPVLLKAAAGGGGKGMRAVHKAEDFIAALAGARREAMAGFADDTMILEKLVSNPRHVEVQIMADNHGEIVHLYERDCSIQRRHQKIIEEAPAPDLSPELRQKLAKAACEVARAINYRGAGTVEFLVEGKENFYFMEMNTRLQVEHPVTEMITDQDLVSWQIKIAANQTLPCKQEDIKIHGHALECRIYAEDPNQGFMPSTGKLHFLKEPQGCDIRLDSGVSCGSSISQFYDPMIAKLIAWGETREQALQKLSQALDHYAIGGVKTNISFLQSICAHPRFMKADLSTDFLTQECITLTAPDPETALLMAISHDYLQLFRNEIDPLLIESLGWQMHLQSSWIWRYTLADHLLVTQITPVNAQEFTVTRDNQSLTLSACYSKGRLLVYDGRQQHSAWVESQAEQLHIYLTVGVITAHRYRWQKLDFDATHHIHPLKAPMPALVAAVLKNEGDLIKKGDALLVLEAMKMEHTIHAPKDGILTKIFYAVGDQVNEGAELVSLQDQI